MRLLHYWVNKAWRIRKRRQPVTGAGENTEITTWAEVAGAFALWKPGNS